MNEIHTNKGFKRECPPEGMIHGFIWIGFDPILDDGCVESIYFFLHTAISNDMCVHDNSLIDRKMRTFMDHGTGFHRRTAGDAHGAEQ